MRRYSPYRSPPRRGYGGRVRSPPRRGYGGRKEHNNGSLLVRNVPLDCRPEDIRIPFERYGRVRDVYIPKDYYTGEPRGFAFVQFVEPCDASEAQYHMNGQVLFGREITVLIAAETRKNPQEMRNRSRVRGPSGYGGRRSSYYGRSRSRSVSRSRSPRHDSTSRMRRRSRSYSPVPRRQADYSVSPERRQTGQPRSPRDHPHERDPRRQADYSVSPERRQAGQLRSPRDHPHERDPRRQAEYSVSPERRQAGQPRSPRDHPHERDPRRQADYSVSPERTQAGQPRSPRDQPHERDEDQIQNRRSYSPDYRNNNWNQSGNGYNERDPYDGEGVHRNWRSPGRISGSPPGSRSRSAELSPRRNRP